MADQATAAANPSDATNPAEALVCFCHGVLEAEIREAIRQGARSLEDIKSRTRASTGCGGCTSECERLLAEMLALSKN